MIEVHITPTRVERVTFVSESDLEEDFDLAAWQAIRPLVAKIDRRLRSIVRGLSSRASAETPVGPVRPSQAANEHVAR
jgi:hypothetical protein